MADKAQCVEPEDVRGVFMVFPEDVHGVSMVFPEDAHGVFMVFPFRGGSTPVKVTWQGPPPKPIEECHVTGWELSEVLSSYWTTNTH